MLPSILRTGVLVDGGDVGCAAVEIAFHAGLVGAVEHTDVGGGAAVHRTGGRRGKHSPLATGRSRLAVVADRHIIKTVEQCTAIGLGHVQPETAAELGGLAVVVIFSVDEIHRALHGGLSVTLSTGEYTIVRVAIEIEAGNRVSRRCIGRRPDVRTGRGRLHRRRRVVGHGGDRHDQPRAQRRHRRQAGRQSCNSPH